MVNLLVFKSINCIVQKFNSYKKTGNYEKSKSTFYEVSFLWKHF